MGTYLPFLLDFSNPEAPRLQAMDDRVMGGRSGSRMRRTDEGTGVFEGLLSLSSEGGFASVRGPVPETDLSPARGVVVRVRGDGRRYGLLLRSERGFSGVSHVQEFQPPAGEWTEVCLPFDAFQAVDQGAPARNARPLATGRIRQVGIIIADGAAGPFRLEVAWVRGWDGS